MSQLKLQELADFGQSIWLDYIDRPLLESGRLKEMIADGLQGMTSNPAIFNNAIGSSTDYDTEITRLKSEGKSTFDIYDALTVKDIQDATDQFLPVYEKTNGRDGYVSLEINPDLADEEDAQIKEGVRLYKAVNRPNVMIKVPATDSGLLVVEELIGQGINVNVTLIFSLAQYERVAKAYLKGLEELSKTTDDLSNVHSVASVFVSRIDAVVDQAIDYSIKESSDEVAKMQLAQVKGKTAVANSRLIFEKWNELCQTDQAKKLRAKGANIQRVLWASTGTKNPEYSDIKYVTELMVSPTVNTIPSATLDAFLDHGEIKQAFTSSAQEAKDVMVILETYDIDVNQVCLTLLEKGVVAFKDAFAQLFQSIETKASQLSV